jgi:hypothetical protein
MHKHTKEEIAQAVNNRVLQVNFHDFLHKASYMQDAELSQDFGISLDETRILRSKWNQSRR